MLWTACLCIALLPLQVGQAQETGLPFLRVGVDAAASALGEAHVAYSRDAFATYWNPAGLAAASPNSVALSHRNWIASEAAYALAARFGAGQQGGLGLFVTAQGSGDLEARELPGAPTGRFTAQYVSFGLAYGRHVGPVRAGVTAKYLSERIYDSAATGYAVDLGLQADVLAETLLLGAAVQNLGSMNELAQVATPLPALLRAGVAVFPLRLVRAQRQAGRIDLLVAAEVVHLFRSDLTQVHAGAGLRLLDVVELRAGLLTNDALRHATFGAGLDVGAFGFDYAFVPFEDGFEGPGHVLTLAYAW